MKFLRLNYLFFIFLLAFQSAFALSANRVHEILPLSKENFIYDHYFQVVDSTQNSEFINLLNLQDIKKTFPLPAIPYNRKDQFGTWIHPKNDHSCLNVRGLVLVRDADSPVTYSADGCSVVSGGWDDPYTAQTFESARDIQIDHFVPLKNAYMTGAYDWDSKKRCLYANYLGNNFHLLAVNGSENMSKGDNSPAKYIPPNKAYLCQYIKQWLSVKVIWSLRLTPTETTAIKDLVETNHCDPNELRMTSDELASQRRFMVENENLCSQPN